MFRKDLGLLTLWRFKYYSKKVGAIFGWTFISTIAILISTKANAAYQCAVTGETCAYQLNATGIYWQLVCKPIYSCIWVPDPPPPSPPPPPPPPPPLPGVKTPAEIEREQHVKFCKEFPGRIDNAVRSCESTARSYHSYFVETKCSGVTSQTWSIGLSIKDLFEAGYTQTVEPGPTCRSNAALALEVTLARCASGGDAYRVALTNQCSDVN